MALNVNELGVIRTYVAITGNAPTQTELQDAFDTTGLNALATALIQAKPAQSNDAFVTDLYTNLLGRAPEAGGLQYWSSLLTSAAGPNQLSKARLAVEFQNAAALNAAAEPDFVDGTAGLSSVNGEFADGTVTPPGGGETPDEIVLDFAFDTTKGEADVTGWSHGSGDPGKSQTFESNTNKIFNVGMQAIDQGAGTISRDYSFRLENQLGEEGHYEAYFLSPILDNVTTNLGSVLTVEVIDRMAEANNKDAALSLVAIESFSFRLNGEEVVVSSQDILDAETYEELAAAIEARIEEMRVDNPALNNVTVELGADFTRQQVDSDTLNTTGANVLGTQILITATGSNLIERGGFGFGDRAGGDRNVDPSGRQDTNVLGSSTDLITTNLELKNVGYGSQGGAVNISGQSMSDKGVQQLDVVAEDHNGLGSWLTSLSSNPLRALNNNFLEVVNLTGDASYFHLGNEQTAALSADGGAVKDGKAEAGLTDVRVFNASQFNQNVRMNAEVTEDVVARDLNLVDIDGNPTNDNVVYSYNLGGGDNALYLSFSETVIAHEDAFLSITSGSGNDNVHLVLDNDATAPTNWQENQKDLGNIVINTGSGNDVIWTEGKGDALILAGAGNDTVYTDNIGIKTEAATWVFNTFNTNIDALLGGDNASSDPTSTIGDSQTGPYFLYKSTITVTLAGAQNALNAHLTTLDADAFDNGFESTVTLDTPLLNGYGADERHINQAIKKAINSDPVLNKLLLAEDGPNNTLVITSKIDGQFNAEDLRVDINAADVTDWTSAEVTSAQNAWVNFPGNTSANVGDAIAGIVSGGVTGILAQHQGLTEKGSLTNNSQLATTSGSTSAVPGTAATATLDLTGFTFNGTAEQNISGGLTLAGAVYANEAALISALTGLPEIASVVSTGPSQYDVTYTVAANGGANPGTGFTVGEDTTGGGGPFTDQTAATSVTAGTAGTPATGGVVDGQNSATESNNIINLGTGQDVLVLSTNELSNEVLVMTGYNNGENTIVNFSEAGTSIDFIDFTSYLTTEFSASGSAESEALVATNYVAETGTVGANSVSIINLSAGTGANANETWENLTASALVAALNGTKDYGVGGSNAIVDGDLDAANLGTAMDAAQIVGTTLNHIVMVENDANDGEYKVFHLTSTRVDANDGDFNTNAQLVGVVDFGESLDEANSGAMDNVLV